MGKINDLSLEKFGTLQPVKPIGHKGTKVLWECRCDCGRTKNVTTSDLRTGNTKSCGLCQRSTLPKDLTGQRFGMLEVIEKTDNLSSNKTAWVCRCDCGTEKAVKTGNLMNGHAKSCGCQVNYNKVSYTGKRFGRLLVGEKAGSNGSHSIYICGCDCGNEILISSSHLKAGRTNSCGCLQKELAAKRMSIKTGDLNPAWKGGTSIDARNCQEYKVWKRSILKRDNRTCQICGDKHELEIHHLYSFVDNIDKRYDVDNGICLCHTCHKVFHMEYGSGDNTPQQLEDFKRSLGLI